MERISGNIFIRPMRGEKAGDLMADGHEHKFDHTTIVFTGAVHVEARLPDGTVLQLDCTAPGSFLVKKDVFHKITATADNTEAWCVYSHRTPQGDVVQEYTGWEKAYV